MPILIDGHNLIGRLQGISLADPDDEEQLVRRLMSYAAHSGKQITVVFDPGDTYAPPRTRRYGRVTAILAAQGTTADSVVVRTVQRSHNPGEWLVVTSDQELAGRVSRMGARTRSAGAFVADLDDQAAGSGDRQDAPLSSAEVDAWMALFKRKR
jgi:predicted RNA-binding protein with PIN domain